jgi:hypothetical protein
MLISNYPNFNNKQDIASQPFTEFTKSKQTNFKESKITNLYYVNRVALWFLDPSECEHCKESSPGVTVLRNRWVWKLYKRGNSLSSSSPRRCWRWLCRELVLQTSRRTMASPCRMWYWSAQVTEYALSSERSTAMPILRLAVGGGVEAERKESQNSSVAF